MKQKVAIVGLAYLALMLAGCISKPEYRVARADDISARISVIDAAGRPIEGAEVWRLVSPSPVRKSAGERAPKRHPLSFAYLDRLAARYIHVPEFAGPWRPGFVAALPSSILFREFHVLGETDSRGTTREIIKFEARRLATARLKYTALSYGYQPTTVELIVEPQRNPPPVRLVLERDPAIRLPSAPYWQRFLRLRSLFTNEEGYSQNLEEARSEMQRLAQDAIAANDRISAARILSWIPYLPTAIHFDTGIARGFTREEETSARNMELLRQAAALDPGNRYIRMKLLLLTPPVDRQARIQAFESLLAEGREDLWPEVFTTIEDDYFGRGDQQKALTIFKELLESEPELTRNQPERLKEHRVRYLSLQEFQRDYLPGGNINSKDEFWNEAIYYAVRAGRPDLYDWIRQNGVNKPLPAYVVIQSVLSLRPEMLRRVLETKSDIYAGASRDFGPEKKQLIDLRAQRRGDPAEIQEMLELLIQQEAATLGKVRQD